MQFFQSVNASSILENPLLLQSSKITYCTANLNQSSEEQIRNFYTAIASKAGSFVRRNEDYKNGDTVGHNDNWIDIVFDEDKKKESFRFSDKYQPLHTDGAYVDHQLDLNFLCCIKHAEIGGDTIFIDSKDIFNTLKKYENELLLKLCTLDVLFDKGDQQSKKAKIISLDDGEVNLNWNYYRVSEKNSKEVLQTCEQFHEFLENKIVRGGLCKAIKIKKGDAVFFFDQKVLHGRNSFFGQRKIIKGGLSL